MNANTLVRHAQAMASAVCNNLRDMIGIEFAPVEDSLEEVRFVPTRTMTAMIHFTGAIQGEFALSLDEAAAARLIGCWSEGMSLDDMRANRPDYGGLVKEVLNVSVGQVIPTLETEFDALTFLPPVVIWGELEYPDVPAGRMGIAAGDDSMECFFVLNMMGLELGERLQAAIQALRDTVRVAGEAKRSVESMLEAFPFGLVTVDREGKVRPGYARRTASTVGRGEEESLAGMHVVDLLGYEESLRRDIEPWLEVVHDRFGQMPFRDLTGLCPVSEKLNERGLLLRLEWVPLVGDDGSLDGLLLMVEDVTEKRRVELEMKKLSKQHEEGVELITQLVNLEPDEVQDFVFDSSGLLDQARQIVQGAHRDRQFIEGLYRTVHTLKGNSGQFQFKGLQKMAFEIENSIARLRDQEMLDSSDSVAGEQVNIISRGLEEAEAYVRRLEELRSKLGSRSEGIEGKALRNAPTVMVPIEQIDILTANLAGMRETGRVHGWSPWLLSALGQSACLAAQMREGDLGRMAPSLQQIAERIGSRLGKKARFALVGSANLDVGVQRELHRCLVHLMNNAIDHGIETPEERLAAGKMETGLVTLEGRREGSDLVVTFSDDGRGVDPLALRSAIVRKGMATAEEVDAMPESEVLDHLFHSGFSTRTYVSDLSGRGVGLDVVRNILREMGGDVAIETHPGKGTRFVMRIPLDIAQPSTRHITKEVPA
jgi:signal transduction histidine kinase/CheY-specific phosphatase CheX